MTGLFNATRRDFLKTTALAAPLAFRALPVRSEEHSSASSPVWNYPGKATRLSIAMWNFSWLLAHYPGGAYQDLEQRVIEAAERGYNTLRVDCFPSRILESKSTFPKRDWTPGVNLPMWGEIAVTHTCNVRKEVANLAALCRKYGIWLGLDSWDVTHMFRSTGLSFLQTSGAPSGLFGLPNKIMISKGDEEQAFAAYGEVWVKALKLMREDGVLERAVWIAPMNEVPNFVQGSVASVIALRRKVTDGQVTKAEAATELNALFRQINDYMGVPIKAEIAKDRIPLSYCSNGDIDYAARVSEIYDVVDLHFMPQVIEDEEDKRAFLKAGPGAPNGNFEMLEKFDLKAWSQAWDDACRRHYPAMLERVSNFFRSALEHMTLPSGKRLQAIVTECYGSLEWPDSPGVSWEWYKLYNADALRIVAAMNLTGASLSNFGEPLFTLWNDLGWHWVSNNYFQTVPLLNSE
jgi:Sugar-binding cellulase-like